MDKAKGFLDEYSEKQDSDPSYIAFDMLDKPEDLINHAEFLLEVINEQKQLPGLIGVEKEYDQVDIEFDPKVEEKQLSYAKVFRVGRKQPQAAI